MPLVKPPPMLDSNQYVKKGGVRCPYCLSDNIHNSGMMNTDVGIAWQPVECDDCGKEWHDEYTLTGYSTLV